jgi:hypothetical protein
MPARVATSVTEAEDQTPPLIRPGGQEFVLTIAVQAALLGAAHQALEPEHAAVWISPHGLPHNRDGRPLG